MLTSFVMNFNKIFGKNITSDDIKSDPPPPPPQAQHSLETVYFLKHILRESMGFLNETSITVFAKSAIFHSK